MRTRPMVSGLMALSLSLVVAGAPPTVGAAPVAGGAPVPAPGAGGQHRIDVDVDGVTVTTRHGAPAALGRAALGFVLDGTAGPGTDVMPDPPTFDEASINLAPRTRIATTDLERLAYWTYQPSAAAARAGVVPALHLHLSTPSEGGRGQASTVVEFRPADSARRVRARRWQRWEPLSTTARWRVLLDTAGRSAAVPPGEDRTGEGTTACHPHDCTVSWRDVRAAHGGSTIAEVRLVLTSAAGGPPASGGTGAGRTRSSGHGDPAPAAAADGLRIAGVVYDIEHGRASLDGFGPGILLGEPVDHRARDVRVPAIERNLPCRGHVPRPDHPCRTRHGSGCRTQGAPCRHSRIT